MINLVHKLLGFWLPKRRSSGNRRAAGAEKQSAGPVGNSIPAPKPAAHRPSGRMIEQVEGRVMFSASTPALPRPDHVVVVVLEDHSYQQILGANPYPSSLAWIVQPPRYNTDPYLRSLASQSAVLTNMTATAHANQSDYQALFSGLAPQAKPDKPLIQNRAPNIASEAIANGLTFGGYSESLPYTGWSRGDKGDYKQGHNPWVDLKNVPTADNLPFTKFPKNHLAALPTISYVVPNEQHNMHSNTVYASDQWMAANMQRYAAWTRKHNSLLIVTWDESHVSSNNIPTFFYGPMVRPGQYAEPASHYNLLSTVEQMFGLQPTNQAAAAAPITDVFNTETPVGG
ncbi:MAG TPA: alkaline phosphatase family protein [Tepidisphaeraceae bacterium]|nr:alkaline phosphatase family protein [Tepidisphaeraceae bacterium]